MPKQNYEDRLGAYVDGVESSQGERNVVNIQAQPIPFPKQGAQDTVKTGDVKKPQQQPMTREERIYREVDRVGWHRIDVKTLPTTGLFMPGDTIIRIRSARGEEIKHWSTMDENEITEVNNAWNYMIERCVNVENGEGGNWRDITELDRLYLLLATRELTFPDEDNNLMVPVSEGKNVAVTKEMVHYIDIPQEIMKWYSPEERCFVFKTKAGREIRMYIPSLGVTEWLYNYGATKTRNHEPFDVDFLKYAPMLIPSYRNLTQKTYEEMVVASQSYDTKEWALITYVVDTLAKATQPVIKYTREDGTEAEVPLNFLGGVKAIFSVSDPLSILC